jgi:hypothetical protein
LALTLTLTSYLQSPTSYLLPPASYLLPLTFLQAELTSYLAELHQVWMEDASNASPKYKRNRGDCCPTVPSHCPPTALPLPSHCLPIAPSHCPSAALPPLAVRLQLVPLLKELAGGAPALHTRVHAIERQSSQLREWLEQVDTFPPSHPPPTFSVPRTPSSSSSSPCSLLCLSAGEHRASRSRSDVDAIATTTSCATTTHSGSIPPTATEQLARPTSASSSSRTTATIPVVSTEQLARPTSATRAQCLTLARGAAAAPRGASASPRRPRDKSSHVQRGRGRGRGRTSRCRAAVCRAVPCADAAAEWRH